MRPEVIADARTRSVRDALAFRATGRSQFPEAAENERREEIREDIAHYTGIVATAASRSEAVARTIAHVAGAENHETFLQQSYTTAWSARTVNVHVVERLANVR